MRFFVTGDKGFIGRNLVALIKSRPAHFVVQYEDRHVGNVSKIPLNYNLSETEPCVHRNEASQWARWLVDNEVEVVIHNAAVVGTDVVALHPAEATLTNVLGTEIIVEACRVAGIPVLYTGTTVVYKTDLYQDREIVETSQVGPHTYYGVTKAAGDQIVRQHSHGTIVRPLFCYGGIGDMNSLPAKIFYKAHKSPTDGNKVDIFLDPQMIKDYLHVDDFCRAVLTICERELWGEDYIVAAESPLKIKDVVSEMQTFAPAGVDLNSLIRWHREADYLGNHRLASTKFRLDTGWQPQISLAQGLQMSSRDIQIYVNARQLASEEYNPLKFLEQAAEEQIDLLKQFR